MNWIFLMKPPEFKIPISVESYDEKAAENYRNYYVAEKRIVSMRYTGSDNHTSCKIAIIIVHWPKHSFGATKSLNPL